MHAHAVRMLRIAVNVQRGEVPSLCCTDDIAKMAREDYDGSVVPNFLAQEKEALLKILNG